MLKNDLVRILIQCDYPNSLNRNWINPKTGNPTRENELVRMTKIELNKAILTAWLDNHLSLYETIGMTDWVSTEWETIFAPQADKPKAKKIIMSTYWIDVSSVDSKDWSVTDISKAYEELVKENSRKLKEFDSLLKACNDLHDIT